MAQLSQGTTISFGGELSEVYSASWSKGGGMPTSRDGTWSDNLGSVTVEAFSPINATYGTRASFSCPGLSGVAVCTSVGGSAQANDVIRYSATFQIVE